MGVEALLPQSGVNNSTPLIIRYACKMCGFSLTSISVILAAR